MNLAMRSMIEKKNQAQNLGTHQQLADHQHRKLVTNFKSTTSQCQQYLIA